MMTNIETAELEIKNRIAQLFRPTLKRIDRQTKCDHQWKEKNGSAYFRCKKCGYLADDLKLDRLIMAQKIIEGGEIHN